MTTNQTALLAYLKDLNAKTQEWLDAGPDRFAGFLSEDLQVWADQGITSVEEFEHDSLISSVYEATREIWGYKPNWAGLKAMTNDELRAASAQLAEDYKRNVVAREEQAAADLLWEEDNAREQFLMAEAAAVDAAEYFGWDR